MWVRALQRLTGEEFFKFRKSKFWKRQFFSKVNFNQIFGIVLLTNQFILLIKLKGGSRTAGTSKMELFMIIVNCFQLLTIITKSSIMDVAAVLDQLLKLKIIY